MILSNLSMVAAVTANNKIGHNNQLLISLREDMQFFRSITKGKTLIMGYNTLMSLPGLLKNRNHIVLSSTHDEVDGTQFVRDVPSIINIIQHNPNIEYIVIGGGIVYREFINYTHRMYITHINRIIEGSVDFPEYSIDDYDNQLLFSGVSEAPLNQGAVGYYIEMLTRKTNNE